MEVESAPGFEAFGVRAFTTTRQAGDFAWQSVEPAHQVFQRWQSLRAFAGAPRLVASHQVHGSRILVHRGGWEGTLREGDADGHLSAGRGTAMAVSLADCVPVFIAHPSGAVAVVHSGWRGTVGDIAGRAIDTLVELGLRASDLVAHCGPAICGSCYVVGPDVYGQLTGRSVADPTGVDLRRLIAHRLEQCGVPAVTISARCTRCDNARFFSHRCGDAGRQVGVIVS
ncbi:MAG: polyphenol oxidase family protein [Gemmatimonadetes bacterium]|nr:polyphenol oxidase family protein [Gemmatimonadota bacterium]